MSEAISSPGTGVPLYKSISKNKENIAGKNLYLDLKPEYKNINEYIQLKGKTVLIHTGYIEFIMKGKCGRNTETTFDIR